MPLTGSSTRPPPSTPRAAISNKPARPAARPGLRFLVVTADGALQPCSMQFQRYPLAGERAHDGGIHRHNTCDECYVSIRSYLDKTFPQLLWENVAGNFR